MPLDSVIYSPEQYSPDAGFLRRLPDDSSKSFDSGHDVSEPNRIPDLTPLYRGKYGVPPYRRRSGVRESIERSRSTLLINLIIEIVAGIILLVGISCSVMFIYNRRSTLNPGQFKLYIEILVFFAIGWFTYIGFKIRTKYLLLKKHWRSSASEPSSDSDSDSDQSS